MMYLLGWGMASCPDPDNNPDCTGGANPEVLQEIQLPVAPQARCKEAAATFGTNLDTSEFCYGGNLGFGGCMGDSGSPLMATSDRGGRTQYILAGSVQGGTRGGCGNEGNYGLGWEWAKYLDWLMGIVGDPGQGDQVLWCKK